MPKTVTRQRRDCDLNPGPTAPESSTLTTRLPSHRFYTVTMRVYRCRFCVSCVFPQLPWVNSIRCAHLMAALIMHACMHAVLSRDIIHGVCAVRPPTRFAREARMLAHFVMPTTRIIRACACGAMHCSRRQRQSVGVSSRFSLTHIHRLRLGHGRPHIGANRVS